MAHIKLSDFLREIQFREIQNINCRAKTSVFIGYVNKVIVNFNHLHLMYYVNLIAVDIMDTKCGVLTHCILA